MKSPCRTTSRRPLKKEVLIGVPTLRLAVLSRVVAGATKNTAEPVTKPSAPMDALVSTGRSRLGNPCLKMTVAGMA